MQTLLICGWISMRVCIVKQPYATEFTWDTVSWADPQSLLDRYVFRSQNFGLVCEMQADIWVVEDGEYVSDTYARLLSRTPEGIDALYRAHTASKWSDVPWETYDIVISLDSIVPDRIIERHPRTLWCYYEQEHTVPSFQNSARSPNGKYDLFFNHALSSASNSTHYLPRSINFPYLCSKDAFSTVVFAKKHDRVYLDSHCVRGVADLAELRARLQNLFGLEVSHCKPWDFAQSYRSVGERAAMSPREYLENLAACKYFLLNRGGERIGQAAPEAAALGVIVLSDRGQLYSRYVCHPETWVEPKNYDSAARAIRKIQADRELQQQIVAYQFERVQKTFLKRPLKVLGDCLEIKRRPTPTGFSFAGFEILRDKAGRKATNKFRNLSSVLLKGRFVFRRAATGAQERRCEKLSIIFTGRNDSYAGDFSGRMRAAIQRNQREAADRKLDVEWIFVEWNPPSGEYLSTELVAKGFCCYVVSPAIHQRIISPRVSDRMSFMQFFAKNVGIRKAAGDWILVTNADCVFDDKVWDAVAYRRFSTEILYRAERCDVSASLFDRPFDVVRAGIRRRYSLRGGKHFTMAAGDFLLFASEKRFGFDETINFSDSGVDGRYCYNWSAQHARGDLDNSNFFQSIGDVFKADHELTFPRTERQEKHHKGFTKWNNRLKTCSGHALYVNLPHWGLANELETEISKGVWYIGAPARSS